MIIDESEREDFLRTITEKGLDPTEFTLKEKEESMKGTVIQSVTGHVTVKRKATGAEKTYKAGHGSSWPADFARDLDRGLFD